MFLFYMNVVFRYANRTKQSDNANDFYICEQNLDLPPATKYRVKLNSCCTYASNGGHNVNDLVTFAQLILLKTEFIELRIDNLGSTNCFDNGNNNSIIFLMDNKYNPSIGVDQELAADANFDQTYYLGQRDSVHTSNEEFIVHGLHLNNIRFRLLNDSGSLLVDGSDDENAPANLIVSLYIEPID